MTAFEALKKFLTRANKDILGAFKVGRSATLLFSATIGAGAEAVTPLTAARGLTAFAISSAFGI